MALRLAASKTRHAAPIGGLGTCVAVRQKHQAYGRAACSKFWRLGAVVNVGFNVG